MIIATAGHVDHGKTSLVRALTGVDTDRLPEEKARGLTIDLGFAYLPLPDGALLGFVDVPGHHRFVKNMLAGVGNVDHALLVVAADDGVMPQTVEHVEILDLLGVTDATVAVTKTDMVAAGRGEEVETEIHTMLEHTSIAPGKIFRTSTRTQEGVPALRAHLIALAGTRRAASPVGRFRLAVDRAFVLPGIGVVATGSVHAGSASAGEVVTIAPAGVTARLRALRIHDREVSSVQAGDRCAIQMSGVERHDLQRGAWIIAGPNHATQRLDVELRLLRRERPLRHWTPAHLHIGAENLTCRIALLSGKAVEPGETAVAVLHVDRPVAAWARQKFILRDQSAQRTIGGGGVLDPLPPPRETTPLRLARLTALSAPDASTAFGRMLAASVRGFDPDAFAQSWNMTAAECESLCKTHPVKICEDGHTRIAMRADHWKAFCDQIVEVLGAHHNGHPELLGLDEAGIHAAFRPPAAKPLLRRAIRELCEAGVISCRGVIFHLCGHRAQPTPSEAALWKRVEPALAANGVRPPRVRELVDLIGIALDRLEAFLARAEQLGWVHRVTENRYFLPETLNELERIAEHLTSECPDGRFAAADFNRASGIGRNLTIQVLEYFDRIGITQRHGDRRAALRAATRAAQP